MKKGFTKTAALMLVTALVITSFTVAKKPVTTYADNPVVQTYFTADPAPLVVGDTMYLITSHDEDVLEPNSPEEKDKFFTMKNWKCYSTKDMVNWTDHGTIFGQSSFEWGHTWRFRAWAAQCVERDGKFYLYVPILRKGMWKEDNSPGYGIGVAVADNPYGPYEDAIGEPLIEGDWMDIDPTVFVDDDGQAYLFYGQTLKYALLNDDMISLKTWPAQFNVPNYVEGPWFTKHNGTYYFMWAGRGGNTSAHKGGETLHYAYCDEPLGNYTYGGLLQETTRGASFTNHPGVVDFKGESYLFYHTDELPSGVGEDSGPHRSVCVEKFTYNDDGTIDPVSMTDGVDPVDTLNPYNRTEAETIAWGLGLKTAGTVNDKGYNDMYVYNMHNEDYIDVRNVDFGNEGAVKFTASVKDAKADADASIEVYLDEDDYIGTVKADNYTDTWKEISVDLNKKVTGIHDVRFVFKGNYQKPENETGLREDKDAYIHEEDTGMFKFDYWQFTQDEISALPAPTINPDNNNSTNPPKQEVPTTEPEPMQTPVTPPAPTINPDNNNSTNPPKQEAPTTEPEPMQTPVIPPAPTINPDNNNSTNPPKQEVPIKEPEPIQTPVTPPTPGTGDNSSQVSQPQPVEKEQLAKVKGLKVKKKGSKKAVVSWKKVAGAEKYELSYTTDRKFKKAVKKVVIKKTKVTVKLPKTGKICYFKARAKSASMTTGKYSAVKKLKW